MPHKLTPSHDMFAYQDLTTVWQKLRNTVLQTNAFGDEAILKDAEQLYYANNPAQTPAQILGNANEYNQENIKTQLQDLANNIGLDTLEICLKKHPDLIEKQFTLRKKEAIKIHAKGDADLWGTSERVYQTFNGGKAGFIYSGTDIDTLYLAERERAEFLLRVGRIAEEQLLHDQGTYQLAPSLQENIEKGVLLRNQALKLAEAREMSDEPITPSTNQKMASIVNLAVTAMENNEDSLTSRKRIQKATHYFYDSWSDKPIENETRTNFQNTTQKYWKNAEERGGLLLQDLSYLDKTFPLASASHLVTGTLDCSTGRLSLETGLNNNPTTQPSTNNGDSNFSNSLLEQAHRKQGQHKPTEMSDYLGKQPDLPLLPPGNQPDKHLPFEWFDLDKKPPSIFKSLSDVGFFVETGCGSSNPFGNVFEKIEEGDNAKAFVQAVIDHGYELVPGISSEEAVKKKKEAGKNVATILQLGEKEPLHEYLKRAPREIQKAQDDAHARTERASKDMRGPVEKAKRTGSCSIHDPKRITKGKRGFQNGDNKERVYKNSLEEIEKLMWFTTVRQNILDKLNNSSDPAGAQYVLSELNEFLGSTTKKHEADGKPLVVSLDNELREKILRKRQDIIKYREGKFNGLHEIQYNNAAFFCNDGTIFFDDESGQPLPSALMPIYEEFQLAKSSENLPPKTLTKDELVSNETPPLETGNGSRGTMRKLRLIRIPLVNKTRQKQDNEASTFPANRSVEISDTPDLLENQDITSSKPEALQKTQDLTQKTSISLRRILTSDLSSAVVSHAVRPYFHNRATQISTDPTASKPKRLAAGLYDLVETFFGDDVWSSVLSGRVSLPSKSLENAQQIGSVMHAAFQLHTGNTSKMNLKQLSSGLGLMTQGALAIDRFCSIFDVNILTFEERDRLIKIAQLSSLAYDLNLLTSGTLTKLTNDSSLINHQYLYLTAFLAEKAFPVYEKTLLATGQTLPESTLYHASKETVGLLTQASKIGVQLTANNPNILSDIYDGVNNAALVITSSGVPIPPEYLLIGLGVATIGVSGYVVWNRYQISQLEALRLNAIQAAFQNKHDLASKKLDECDKRNSKHPLLSETRTLVQIKKLQQSVNESIKAENYNAAITTYKEIELLSPENKDIPRQIENLQYEAGLMRAQAYILTGNVDLALSDLNQANHLNPGDFRAPLTQAQIMRVESRYEDANKYVELALNNIKQVIANAKKEKNDLSRSLQDSKQDEKNKTLEEHEKYIKSLEAQKQNIRLLQKETKEEREAIWATQLHSSISNAASTLITHCFSSLSQPTQQAQIIQAIQGFRLFDSLSHATFFDSVEQTAPNRSLNHSESIQSESSFFSKTRQNHDFSTRPPLDLTEEDGYTPPKLTFKKRFECV